MYLLLCCHATVCEYYVIFGNYVSRVLCAEMPVVKLCNIIVCAYEVQSVVLLSKVYESL